MKLVKLYSQEDNRTVGIAEESNGTFTAMTFSQSKTFKSFNAADKWIQKYL